jgi:hypothetical protein
VIKQIKSIRLLITEIKTNPDEVIAKFQKAQDFFSEAEDKKEVLVCKIR